jgi:hypothetical protein
MHFRTILLSLALEAAPRGDAGDGRDFREGAAAFLQRRSAFEDL